jgi:allantoinase
MFHAELALDEENELKTDPKLYDTFLHSRFLYKRQFFFDCVFSPKEMENKAIELVIKLCREYQVRCHIVHLSSSEALPIIRNAKKEGVPLSVETCYHYLFFESEAIPDGKENSWKFR